jgi:hypothetical protein
MHGLIIAHQPCRTNGIPTVPVAGDRAVPPSPSDDSAKSARGVVGPALRHPMVGAVPTPAPWSRGFGPEFLHGVGGEVSAPRHHDEADLAVVNEAHQLRRRYPEPAGPLSRPPGSSFGPDTAWR